jgi:hypothetical protein
VRRYVVSFWDVVNIVVRTNVIQAYVHLVRWKRYNRVIVVAMKEPLDVVTENKSNCVVILVIIAVVRNVICK